MFLDGVNDFFDVHFFLCDEIAVHLLDDAPDGVVPVGQTVVTQSHLIPQCGHVRQELGRGVLQPGESENNQQNNNIFCNLQWDMQSITQSKPFLFGFKTGLTVIFKTSNVIDILNSELGEEKI